MERSYYHVKSPPFNINNGIKLITSSDPFNHHVLSQHGKGRCIILDSMIVFSILLKSVTTMHALRPSYVHGDMNTRFPSIIPIYDYNLQSSTNLIPNYFTSMTLLSLPIIGTLYTDIHFPLYSIPEEGLLLTNVSLYYQPPQGFYHNSIPYVYLIV